LRHSLWGGGERGGWVVRRGCCAARIRSKRGRQIENGEEGIECLWGETQKIVEGLQRRLERGTSAKKVNGNDRQITSLLITRQGKRFSGGRLAQK